MIVPPRSKLNIKPDNYKDEFIQPELLNWEGTTNPLPPTYHPPSTSHLNRKEGTIPNPNPPKSSYIFLNTQK